MRSPLSSRGNKAATHAVLSLLCAMIALRPSPPTAAAFTHPIAQSTIVHSKSISALHESVMDSPPAVPAITNGMPDILSDFCHETSPRLPYSPTGYSTWKWVTHHNPLAQQTNNNDNTNEPTTSPTTTTTTHSINYLALGPTTAPAIVLIHGFGASAYHWRHNLPALARSHRVYALDLLGFGWSDKPVMDYDASVWRDQVVDFVREVVLREDGGGGSSRRVVVAGNSLGGYTAMYAAGDTRIKEYVRGCVLLNSAGRFRDPEGEVIKAEPNPVVKSISAAIQRLVIAASFIYTKQPARIEQILRNVYPVNSLNVDSELVQSIQTPSLDPNAAECPVLLCWGEKDPWIRSAAADRMENLHAQFHGDSDERWMKRVSVDAGHCPHDESPEEVNQAILEFVGEVFR
ncbi:hypothetical protein HJC23_002417 [Cyclotella cryptica]|uniref:AB hydrolase-1 domain-containing protein n=1 Tax=Cyclotella cryptica TaxID=29204 RepID=A0ABD3QLQ6_9STRA